jgi:NAD(P)H dehydrogenase (quinone)
MADILVLYVTRFGAVQKMAEFIAQGIDSVPGMHARIRTVPPVSPEPEQSKDRVPQDGPPFVTHRDLEECVGLALGSPTRFGNMAASMKYFWDTTAGPWFSGTLSGKPASVFTSSSSLHGGQESTLFTMMVPLMHHGMLMVGIPFTEARLVSTQTGGTPYGPSHVAGAESKNPISEDEKMLCIVQGKRLAEIAKKLAAD